MRLVFVSGLSAACIGMGMLLVLNKSEKQVVAPASPEIAVVAAPPSCPPPPSVLADVIELTDLDPLLDPPARAISDTPFEEPQVVPAIVPASAIAAPDRIPLSID